MKLKRKTDTRLSVLGSQLSDKSLPVISQSVTEKQKTGKPESENPLKARLAEGGRKLKTDNRWQPCPNCGFPIGVIAGSKEAMCRNCGFKDPCCE